MFSKPKRKRLEKKVRGFLFSKVGDKVFVFSHPVLFLLYGGCCALVVVAVPAAACLCFC